MSSMGPVNFNIKDKVCVLSANTLEGKREEMLQVYRGLSKEEGFRYVNVYVDKTSFDALKGATERDRATKLERSNRVSRFETRAAWARNAMIVSAVALAVGLIAGYIVVPALVLIVVAAIAKRVFSSQARKAATDVQPVHVLQYKALKGLYSVHNEKMERLLTRMGAQWVGQYHQGSVQQKSDILRDAEIVVSMEGKDRKTIKTIVPDEILNAAKLIVASANLAKKND
jgi:hypothetical protein